MLKVVRASRLIDGTGRPPLVDAEVVVEGDRIKAVGNRRQMESPEGAEVIDLGDRWLVPGLIDAHVHFFGVDTRDIPSIITESEVYRALRSGRDARRMLRAGFTTVNCKGSTISPQLARAISEGIIPGPRVVASGQFICSTYGTWDALKHPLDRVTTADMLADGVEQCRAIVRRRLREGARMIKIGTSAGAIGHGDHSWGDDPVDQRVSYSLEEVRAITDEAHRWGIKVSAHAIGDDSVRLAVLGGVDIIEHGHGMSDETRSLIVDRNLIVVPTLSQPYMALRFGTSAGVPAAFVQAMKRHYVAMVRQFEGHLRAGVRLALGTDLVGDPWWPHGHSAQELELMVSAGMSCDAALQAATRVAAEAVGLSGEIGTIESQKLADMIAVPRDPLADAGVFQSVEFVMKAGDIYVQEGEWVWDDSRSPSLPRSDISLRRLLE